MYRRCISLQPQPRYTGMGNANCAGQKAPVGLNTPVGYSAYGREQQVRRIFDRHGDVQDCQGTRVNLGIPLSLEPADDPFEAVHEALKELHLHATPVRVSHSAQALEVDPAAQHLGFGQFLALVGDLDFGDYDEPQIQPGCWGCGSGARTKQTVRKHSTVDQDTSADHWARDFEREARPALLRGNAARGAAKRGGADVQLLPDLVPLGGFSEVLCGEPAPTPKTQTSSPTRPARAGKHDTVDGDRLPKNQTIFTIGRATAAAGNHRSITKPESYLHDPKTDMTALFQHHMSEQERQEYYTGACIDNPTRAHSICRQMSFVHV